MEELAALCEMGFRHPLETSPQNAPLSEMSVGSDGGKKARFRSLEVKM
jgi:hypothetical protein